MKTVFLAFALGFSATAGCFSASAMPIVDEPAPPVQNEFRTASAAPPAACSNALADRFALLMDRIRVFASRQLRRSKMLIQGRYPHYAEGFYSQNGQDKWLAEEVFYGRGNGNFAEIGAHDGVEFSNTYFFEKEKKWRGLCVEPVPSSFAALQRNRKCKAVQACISPIEGTVPFFLVDVPDEKADGVMLSGIAMQYSPEHLERIQNEIQKFRGRSEVIDVPSYHLQTLLDENRMSVHVDYLSVDTEGSELDVLETIDFSRVSISVISVENNYGDIKIRRFLESKGYRRVKRIGQDDFYFASDFKPISKH